MTINRYRAQRKNRVPIQMEITGHNTATYHRPGGYTKVELEGKILTWATSEYVRQELLDLCAYERNQERRAPLGNSHGGWQKVGTFLTSMLTDQLPMEHWEDTKAFNRVLNDSDLRAFRTDGNHRVA